MPALNRVCSFAQQIFDPKPIPMQRPSLPRPLCNFLSQQTTNNMKTNIVGVLFAALATLSTTSCGNPKQKIRLKVTDEAGAPIKDAKCMACWWKDVGARDSTNGDGLVEFTGQTGLSETLVQAEVAGCYKSDCYTFLMGFTPKKTGNRWEPWPVELTFVMKKIIRPHPMYFVTKMDGASSVAIPGQKQDQEFGYDIIERDWIAPHGKGKVADFLITASLETPGDTAYDPHGWVRLRFTNLQDGIIEYKNASSGGSILQGPHEAPEAGYQPEMKFANWFDAATQELRNQHNMTCRPEQPTGGQRSAPKD